MLLGYPAKGSARNAQFGGGFGDGEESLHRVSVVYHRFMV